MFMAVCDGTVHALTPAVMVRPPLLIPLALLLVTLAACQSANSNKTELKTCTAGENGCPSEQAITGKPKGDGSGGDSPTDQAPAPPPAAGSPPAAAAEKGQTEKTPSDPGSPAEISTPLPDPPPDGTVGGLSSCGQLQACCDSLTAFGQDATTCTQTMTAGVESDCEAAFQQYTSDPFGPGCGTQN
jgi:hypothetical protein